MELQKVLKGKVFFSEPLSRHTTFGIGGAPSLFILPRDEEDLKVLLTVLKRGKIPVLVIGCGSNILASDRGISAAVIALRAPFFRRLKAGNTFIEAGAGASLAQLIRLAQRQGLSGIEFLSGIPGTVGGALAMNAGVTEGTKPRVQRSIADAVVSVRVMDARGRVSILNKKDIRFGYRDSGLSKFVILGARLKFKRAPRKEISREVRRYLAYRRQAHGWAARSAGCVFRNPSGLSAGRLIDLCGLKVQRKGGACISSAHANLIL
ncbi:MAG: UDP-N-acetylmuramate dehydrogenase, partial [Candidatus Omnitrophica bacterium]|nr:UDP-N-acetylmuramate dehydrogenase [Candidatus Omnitrophota bacterium]